MAVDLTARSMLNEALRPLALITGASGGVGFELARRFIAEGYDVALVADDRDSLTQAAQLLGTEDENVELEIIAADLSQPEGVALVHTAVRAMARPVDVLAANAGLAVSGRFATQTDLDAEIALINLNVTSQVHLIKLIAFEMVERGRGDILITSSPAGRMPGPFMAVYAASQAFLHSFGEAIRQELQETGVNVAMLLLTQAEAEVPPDGTKAAAEVANAAIAALRSGSARAAAALSGFGGTDIPVDSPAHRHRNA